MPGMTAMTGYLYDAAGTRVAKGSISTWSCDPAANGFQTTNDYILGLSGEQLTEMGVDTRAGSNASTLAWQHTNVWAGGKLLATYDADGLHFYLNDPLGTRRVQTDYAGVIEQSCVSLPYGDGLNCTGSTIAPTEHHFTAKERDSESGNDYFEARYYASSMGRFLSPDDGTDQHPDNPQSWNLYTYGRNNPLVFTDPTGHSTQTAANGDVLAVYDDKDLGVYRHGDIDNRKDWDGSKLDDTDPQTSKMGQTERWGEFANWNSKNPDGISGSAAPGAFIHFGQSIDSTIQSLNAQSNKQGLSSTAIDSTHGGPLDIKTGSKADHGVYTGYLLNGNYASIRSAGNFLAGLNAMTGTFAGSHISPQFAQKLFGAYQAGGKTGLAYTLTTGKAYPGTSAPYWGEENYSGYMQQKGINAGSQK
jgi:RHS repeat-associated protein